jgi:hypothetical protein
VASDQAKAGDTWQSRQSFWFPTNHRKQLPTDGVCRVEFVLPLRNTIVHSFKITANPSTDSHTLYYSIPIHIPQYFPVSG